MTVVSRRNAQLDTAPGIPADAAALQSHARNLEAATEAMLNGRKFEVEPLSGQFAERPPTPQYEGDEFFRAIRESGYSELLDDIKGLEADLLARGRTLDDEALPELSRRAEDGEVSRLRDLRAQWKEGKLDPAQYDELQALETKDRMTAKVGGRRIEQVRNLESYTEDLDAGRLMPLQGFMDADNFKALNDELGHGAGDQAIAMIGIISPLARRSSPARRWLTDRRNCTADAMTNAVAIVVAVVRTQLVGAIRPESSFAAGTVVLGLPARLGDSSGANTDRAQFVFAIWVLLLLVAGVGVVGVPVSAGLALGAYWARFSSVGSATITSRTAFWLGGESEPFQPVAS
jgi:hypothetical protein